MQGFLLSRGYTVIPDRFYTVVLKNFRIENALVFQCNAAGTAPKAVIGISQKVSCSAVDYETGKQVYNGFGEHMGDFEEDDFIGATAAALNNITITDQTGRIISVQELARNFAVTEKESPDPEERSDEDRESSGTGFFINAKGYITTNHHVIDKCRTLSVTTETGRKVDAETIIFSEDDDLAVIKTNLTPKTYASISAPPQQGEYVATYGFPLSGLLSDGGSYSDGRISALKGLSSNKNSIQISVPLQPGNSGGALVNRYGQLVGIVASKLNATYVAEKTGDIPQNVNFAVKESRLTRLLDRADIPYGRESSIKQAYLPEKLNNVIKGYTVFITCQY